MNQPYIHNYDCDDYLTRTNNAFVEAYNIATNNQNKAGQRIKDNYDKKLVKSQNKLEVNQLVYVKQIPGLTSKLKPLFTGPYKVIKLLDYNVVLLQEIEDENSKPFLMHIDRLKILKDLIEKTDDEREKDELGDKVRQDKIEDKIANKKEIKIKDRPAPHDYNLRPRVYRRNK